MILQTKKMHYITTYFYISYFVIPLSENSDIQDSPKVGRVVEKSERGQDTEQTVKEKGCQHSASSQPRRFIPQHSITPASTVTAPAIPPVDVSVTTAPAASTFARPLAGRPVRRGWAVKRPNCSRCGGGVPARAVT